MGLKIIIMYEVISCWAVVLSALVTLNHLGFGAIYVYNPLYTTLQYIVCENFTLLHACLNFLSVLL